MPSLTDHDFRVLYESGEFDSDWYSRSYPDVGMLSMGPAEHYLRFGRLMGRPGRAGHPAGTAVLVESVPPVEHQALVRPAADLLEAPAPRRPDHPFLALTDKLPRDPQYPVSNYMYYIWSSRPDLQKIFDLHDAKARAAFCEWSLMHCDAEYGMRGWAYPEALLKTFTGHAGRIGVRARQMLNEESYIPTQAELASGAMRDDGANLIGYARGEFGMGEHVRAVAEALDEVGGNFSIINVPETGIHGEGDGRVESWITDRQEYTTNIFHINADVLPSLYFRLGPEFFERRYNIGYWAWELADCPSEFDMAAKMMDEVWGISEFVTNAFRQNFQLPVVNMPLAVELPPIEGNYSKRYFGLEEEEFVFLFTFDGASFLERKNPLALIRAFRNAFPKKTEKARLLLKTMNISRDDPKWKLIAREAAKDRRITIYDKRLKRDEVLGLYIACDSFVSLHRAEGFGRCLAEAMLLGKPVVATGYSGSNDFIREDTACVVDFRLIPVEEGAYPFWQNQMWADADVEHAAAQMRKLFYDDSFRREIARSGQAFIRDNFNYGVVGARYKDRLDLLRQRKSGWTPQQAETPEVSLLQGLVSRAPQANASPLVRLLAESDRVPGDDEYPISSVMYGIWEARPDLEQSFPLHDRESRIAFCEWFIVHGAAEYDMTGSALPLRLLETLSAHKGGVAEKARQLRSQTFSRSPHPAATGRLTQEGVNIVGYARGQLGLGEQLRTMAEALDTTEEKFAVVNVSAGGQHTDGDNRVDSWIERPADYDTNIIHINADVLPLHALRLGERFFDGRYNVGFWAWELSNCPPAFDTAIDLVDEIWTNSEFAADAIRQRTNKPVLPMAMPVELPTVDPRYTKATFGLPSDVFLFLFSFDAASYLDRKNPLGVIEAFRLAFPQGTEPVRLLLKTMNTPTGNPGWDKIVRAARSDTRIVVLSRKMDRGELLGLMNSCDAYVSLHRSEGFGFGMAESMLLGKPVVATGYSGSNEFIRPQTACVVDFELIPVPEGAYPFWQGQVWAEPDIVQAASYMERLFREDAWRGQVASKGQRFVTDHFNRQVIGQRYSGRLEQLRKQRREATLVVPPLSHVQGEPAQAQKLDPQVIFGSLDFPPEQASEDIFGTSLRVSGWVTGGAPVESISVRCDKGTEQEAHHGFLRPDIGAVHPEGIDAGRSGFGLVLDLATIGPGKHRITVKARSVAGAELEWKRDVRICDPSDLHRRWKAGQNDPAAVRISFLLRCGQLSAAERKRLRDTAASIAGQAMCTAEIILLGGEGVAAFSQGLELPSGVTLVGAEPELAAAIGRATGEFICPLRAGDLLLPGALAAAAVNIASSPTADLIYADEEQFLSGVGVPLFKPGWSPLYLREYNYVGRPFLMRREIAVTALREASASEPAIAELDEHALLRAAISRLRRVVHVPAIMARTVAADRMPLAPASPAMPSGGWPPVSIIIPTRLAKLPLVEACFRGLVEFTDYPGVEVVVVANNMPDRDRSLEWMRQWPFKIVEWDKGFNWSGLNNLGVRNATHDLLLFLNDDVEPLDRGWLKEMVSAIAAPQVGIVGALLTYPNGLIQHAGMNLGRGDGETHHTYRLRDPSTPSLVPAISVTREQSLVTGACMLTRRAHYDAAGGFDESLPIVCNDADFCFRQRDLGLSVVLAGRARLSHYEGISRAGISETEDFATFSNRWRVKFSEGDPYMNPNLDLSRSDGTVATDAHQSWIGRVFENPCYAKD